MKKKVLFWLEMFDKGGIEKATLDLVNNLDPNKYEITVMQKFKGGYCRSQLRSHIKKRCCFPLFANGISRIFLFLPGSILYKLFIHEKYDIEIACGDGGPSRIIAGSNNPKSKKIAWIHMDVTQVDWPIPEYKTEEGKKKFYEPFDEIICVSNECKEKFIQIFGQENKCKVIYNPILKEEVIQKSLEKLDSPFSQNYLNCIAIGRLVHEKGYDRLLEVHRILIKKGILHNLYIIGEGQEREALECYIKKYNLKNTLKLVGFQENPYKYINAADLIICSSRHESFSLVIAESLIIGKPIISTKCIGPTELLGDGEYGMLVENNKEALCRGLEKMLTDNHLLDVYAEKSKIRANLFNFEKVINSWEELMNNE